MSPSAIRPPAPVFADSLRPPGGGMEFASRNVFKRTAPTHGHWGSNGAWAGSVPAGAVGAMGIGPRPRESASAALGGRDVLDRDLRRGVRLHNTHLLVVAMMAHLLVAHPRIGLERLRLGLVGL